MGSKGEMYGSKTKYIHGRTISVRRVDDTSPPIHWNGANSQRCSLPDKFNPNHTICLEIVKAVDKHHAI